jgi:hypothetical protein
VTGNAGARAATQSRYNSTLLNRQSTFESTWPVWCVAAAIALLLAVPTRTDPDLWGHVRFGLDWLHSHRLPSTDPYSFTQDRPWINHEWLSEIASGAAFAIAGSAGLVLLKGAVVVCTMILVAHRLRGASPILASALVLLSAAAALPVTATVRPQIWSLLCLTILILILDSRVPFRRRLIWLALLFATWANLHGGWITGYGALAIYTSVAWLFRRTTSAHTVATVLVAGTATLLNPYGVGLWRFLASTVRAARPDISEWQPFSIHEPAIMWVAVLLPIVVLAALAANKKTRPRPELVATSVVLIAAGLRVSRVAPLICPAVIAALGPTITAAWGEMGRLRVRSRAGALILLTPAIPLWVSASAWATQDVRCIPIRDTWMPDMVAAQYLEGTKGRLWVAFDWGEYAIWHFGPALRVSIDGRRETVYSNDLVTLHRDFDRGTSAARAGFLRLDPDYVWLRRGDGSTRDWLTAHGYRIRVQTSDSFVAMRANVAAPASSGRKPLSSCFP